jgi:hypothetical protein
MRVPTSATEPTFDQTFRVGFWRWLTSSKPDRAEWARRRNAAAEAARRGQDDRVQRWADRKRGTE